MLLRRPLVETTCTTFPERPDQVRAARRFIADLLGADWARLDDVLLLASEVAANAVRHSASGDGGQFDVSVAVFATGLAVRVAVADQGGATEPVLSGSAADAEGGMTEGRGLHIVDILADRWSYRGDVLGRLVWFEVMAQPEE